MSFSAPQTPCDPDTEQGGAQRCPLSWSAVGPGLEPRKHLRTFLLHRLQGI